MKYLAFIDLETTGLDCERNGAAILEVACVITDIDLKEVARFERLTGAAEDQLSMGLEFMCEEGALAMHKTSGLYDAWEYDSDPETMSDTEDAFASWLEDYGPKQELIVVGNSIASLDLPFLRKFMPRVLDHVHYRTIDVSGLRTAMHVATGEEWAYPKTKGHRAMRDVEECIREFAWLSSKLRAQMAA